MALFFAMALVLTGCGGGSESGAEEGGEIAADGKRLSSNRTLRVNLGTEPESLDPSHITSVAGNKSMHGLMEGLIWLDKDNQPQPGVAESWEHNEDFTVWTFKLRQNAKWHNGDLVTAHDFVYGVQRILTPATAANYASNVYNFLEGGREYYDAKGLSGDAPFEGVKALDDYTVQYNLTAPSPFFLNVTAFANWLPLNRRVIEEFGEAWSTSPRTFVGNGAFRMAEFLPGDRIITKKADTYWDKDAIFWEQVDLLMISDATTENAAYMNGEIDVTQTVMVSELNYWKDKPDYYAPHGLATYFVLVNTKQAPFDNPLVRRAFNKAIDRKLIVERVTRRGEPAATGLIPPSLPSPAEGTYRDRAGDLIGDYDIEEAKKLLAQAGYGPNKPLPPIEYIYNSSDEHKLIAEQLQAMWREAFDVDVRLQNMEWAVLKGRQDNHDYMLARSSWVGDYIDPLTFMEIFVSTSTQNDPQMTNARYDELVNAARNEEDQVKREQLFIEAEKILIHEEAAILPIYHYVYSVLRKPDLDGVHYNALANLTYVRGRRLAS